MTYYVYMVQCANNALYTGVTNDVQKRVDQHNGIIKGGAKYTQSHRPVILVFVEEHPSRPSALKREAEIKSLTREQKLALICAESDSARIYDIS